MPPKRRTSGPAAKSQQSTLAFHGTSNKVTKGGVRAPSGKNNVVADAVEPTPAKPEIIELKDEPTTAEAAIIEQTEKEVVAQQEAKSTPEEDAARRISDAAIRKYWAAKEKERMAPRMHQEDLSVHEKVLREFDMSGHYGPSTGIARLKRWKRAHKLDLDPPIEVLAVLLKEMDDKDKAITVQRSRVDELLSSKMEEPVN